MKLQIRQGTFETNSSSTHSLVVYKDKLVKVQRRMDFTLKEYGWDWGKEEFHNYMYVTIFQKFMYDEPEREHGKKVMEMLKSYLDDRESTYTMPHYNVYLLREEKITYEEREEYYSDFGVDHDSYNFNFMEWLLKEENWGILDVFMSSSYIITGNDNCYEDECITPFLPKANNGDYERYDMCGIKEVPHDMLNTEKGEQVETHAVHILKNKDIVIPTKIDFNVYDFSLVSKHKRTTLDLFYTLLMCEWHETGGRKNIREKFEQLQSFLDERNIEYTMCDYDDLRYNNFNLYENEWGFGYWTHERDFTGRCLDNVNLLEKVLFASEYVPYCEEQEYYFTVEEDYYYLDCFAPWHSGAYEKLIELIENVLSKEN